MTTFRISASSIKAFLQCERGWYRQNVLKVEREQKSYLTKGDDFDAAVQARVRGQVHTPANELVRRQLEVADRALPAPGRAEAQFQYLVSAGDGLLVVGKPDVRWREGRTLRLQDTKTTSDRGPGRGADADRQPYSLTDEHTAGGNLRPLRDDIQFRLYSWCEFTLAAAGAEPPTDEVRGEWVYVSKDKSPKTWTSRAVLGRAEAEEWFESFVRPLAVRMRELSISGLPELQTRANPESCRRCLVAAGCAPYDGANVYGLSEPQKRSKGMVFDIRKLRGAPAAAPAEAPAPEPTLETQLEASVAEVAINRPKPGNAAEASEQSSIANTADVLTVGSITGSPQALALLELEPSSPAVGPAWETSTDPKAPTPEAVSVTIPAGAHVADAGADAAAVTPEAGAATVEQPTAELAHARKPRARRARPATDARAAELAELRANLEQAIASLNRLEAAS